MIHFQATLEKKSGVKNEKNKDFIFVHHITIIIIVIVINGINIAITVIDIIILVAIATFITPILKSLVILAI